MFIPAVLASIGTMTAGAAGAAGAAGVGASTAAAASLGGTVLSTALGVGGALYSGISGMNMANYQAQVAQNNQRMALQMQERAKAEGDTAAYEQDLKNRAMAGQARAQMGASGIDMNSGTMLDLQASQTQLGRLDTLRAKGAKDFEAWRYGVQANQFAAQANLAEAQGTNSLLAGFINAGSSLIGGASNFATRWTEYDRLDHKLNPEHQP